MAYLGETITSPQLANSVRHGEDVIAVGAQHKGIGRLVWVEGQ